MHDYIFMLSVLVVLIIAILIVTFSKFSLSSDQYDRLKSLVLKWPAMLTLLGVLVATFHFLYGEETITVVAAIGAFLSRCLGVSTVQYEKWAIPQNMEEPEDSYIAEEVSDDEL